MPSSASRVKLNSLVTTSIGFPVGTIQRRYGKWLQYLLQNNDTLSADDFELLYEPDNELGRWLANFRDGETSQYAFLIGSTGIGKSAGIRHAFGATSKVLFKSDVASAELIIPVQLARNVFDKHNLTKRVTNKIREVADLLARGLYSQNQEELTQYIIEAGRADLLEYGPVNRPRNASEDLRYLMLEDEYAYQSMRVKLRASKSEIFRVSIIIDNIENAHATEQVELTRLWMSFAQCLLGDYSPSTRIITKVLITARPATHTQIMQSPHINQYQYSQFQIIAPPPLTAVIRRRFGLVQSRIQRNQIKKEDQEECERASEFLLSMLAQLYEPSAKTLIGLSNFNVREACDAMSVIATNSQWYETGRGPEGAFDISKMHFANTETRILRSLILRSNYLYRSNVSPDWGGNVFANFEEPKLDFCAPLLAKMFIKKMAPNGAVASISRIAVRNTMRLFTEITEENLNDLISRFVDWRLLRIEMDVLIGQPKLATIWRHLNQSAILLEFMRDDTYISGDDAGIGGDLAPTSRLSDADLILAMVRFAVQVAGAETDSIIGARKLRELKRYREEFGKRSLARRLYNGVKASYERIFGVNDPKRSNEIPGIIQRELSRLEITTGEVQRQLNTQIPDERMR